MAKSRVQYVCQNCGSTHPKWMGRCPDCGEWNTLIERIVEEPRSARQPAGPTESLPPQRLTEVQTETLTRIQLPMRELSRVLGGGIVPGSLILIGGDPGIGKSTLLLQTAALIAVQNGEVLYVSGEESTQQLKMRADRLGITTDRLWLLTETNLNRIIDQITRMQPAMVVIDSIQTVYLEELTSTAGSISQVRESAARLLHIAKSYTIPIFLVGHVTKAGAIAGPRVLEHIVDVVLYLEGDRFHTYRLLRSVKNRFGATHEVGVFEMKDTGLAEVPNPSAVFLEERLPRATGSAIAVTMEGTRPILVEIQALTSTTAFGHPRRTANGIDINRLLLLIAVLSKRVGLPLADQDVFANVVGGLRIGEPAADLAIAIAIASSVHNRPVAADTALIGEIGLSGELRSVSHIEQRLNEAFNLGFRRCIIPRTLRRQINTPKDLTLLPVRTINEAIDLALIQP